MYDELRDENHQFLKQIGSYGYNGQESMWIGGKNGMTSIRVMRLGLIQESIQENGSQGRLDCPRFIILIV